VREDQRLLPPDRLRAMMLDALRGETQAALCARYGLTPVQFQRQKYYHRAAALEGVRREVLARLAAGETTAEAAAALGLPLAAANELAVGVARPPAAPARRPATRTCTVTALGRVVCRQTDKPLTEPNHGRQHP